MTNYIEFVSRGTNIILDFCLKDGIHFRLF
jgi:hypothetical protein